MAQGRGGKSMRVVAILSMALSTLGLVPLRASAGPVTPLGAETVIEASSSGSALVELRRKATFSLDLTARDPDLRIEGRGRVIAFTLQRAGSSSPSESVRMVRYNGCFTTGCAPDEPRTILQAGFAVEYNGDEATLKAGAYKLGVLTDGGPVTARLRLRGPTGSARVTPDLSAESGFRPIASTNLGSGATETMTWSGGTEFNLTSANSVVFAFAQQDSPTNTGAVAYVCQFGDGARPARGHYLPGCPAEGGDVVFGTLFTGFKALSADTSLPPSNRMRILGELRASRGPQAAGFNFSRTSSAAVPRGYIAFLRLD